MAVHEQMPLFATTTAPQNNPRFANGAGQAEPRKFQKLNAYRVSPLPDLLDDYSEDTTSTESSPYNSPRVNGNRNEEEYSPVQLSSVILPQREPGAVSFQDPQSSQSPIPGLSCASSYVKRKFGAGFNAMAWHPHAFILAVGSSDPTQGSVRLITYDKDAKLVNNYGGGSADRNSIVRRYE